MEIKIINREVGDKAKGFRLQKLRTISLILKRIQKSPNSNVLAAVEYQGDIFLKDEKYVYIEENKNYSSQNFSFANPQVLNTLVYFIDCWLGTHKSKETIFGFYATNDYAKEINSEKTKLLGINLPDKRIIELLINQKFKSNNLIDAISKFVSDEYKSQYTKVNGLDTSNYSTIQNWSEENWVEFLKQIRWYFGQDNENQLEKKILEEIKNCVIYKTNSLKGKEQEILHRLFYELDKKQVEKDYINRFINYDNLENAFLKARENGDIKFDRSLNILAISDLNYNTTNKDFAVTIIDKICEILETEAQIDLIIFSGNLLKEKVDLDSFLSAKECLDKFVNVLKIKGTAIFICPGVNDLNINLVNNGTKSLFKNDINDNEKINEFITNSKSADYLNSISLLNNFNEFIDLLPKEQDDIIHDLYAIRIRNILNEKIVVVILKTVWTSFISEDNHGKIIYPIQIIEEIIDKIKTEKFRILITHIPFDSFKVDNYIEIQKIVHNQFDVIFTSPNSHKTKSFVSQTNGIFEFSNVSSLQKQENKIHGFAVLNIDLNDYNGIVNVYEFKDASHVNTKKPFSIPFGNQKEQQNKFREKVSEKYDIELENSNNLLIGYNKENGFDFLSTFNLPLLNKKSDAEITKSNASSNYNFNLLYNFEDNYLIFGKDKSGKTSILKKIQLHHLSVYSNSDVVPFYIDFKVYGKTIDKNFSILKLIRDYYSLNERRTKELIRNHKLRLLIDNFDPNSKLYEILKDFLYENPNVGYVICSEYTISRALQNFDFGELSFIRLFIHDLTRTEIRIYVNNIDKIKVEDKENVHQRIVTLCNQLQLPVNFWTISLLLLIYNKSKDDIYKNLYEILDFAVDEMLNKKMFGTSKTKIFYPQFKELCSILANHLLTKCENNVYSDTESNIINKLNEIVQGNRRIDKNIKGKDLFNHFIETGILKRQTDFENIDDLFTFRLNGIFEFFNALYLSEHSEELNEIIGNDDKYLSYKNEFELISGFKPDNKIFVKDIFNRTKVYLERINNEYKQKGTIDEILKQNIVIFQDIKALAKDIAKTTPLSPAIQDKLEDEENPLNIKSSVQPKIKYDLTKFTPEIFEKFLTILSRVLKNSYNLKDDALEDEIFDFILENYCYMGFFIVDDMKRNPDLKEFLDIENIELQILKIIANFIPIYVQISLYDGIGHSIISGIVEEKIRKLKENPDKHQYELFLLYFLLVDIDIHANKKYIDEILLLINNSVIRFSTLLKLNFYLQFKAYDNPELKKFILQKVRDIEYNINSKLDEDDLNRQISKKEKLMLINRRKS